MNKELIKAVLNQIGISKKEFKENVSDYFNAANGVSGFIYYGNTHKFALDNQESINELLDELSDEQGVDVIEMVQNFGIFKGKMDKEEKKDLYKFLGGNNDIEAYETNSVLNVLAWLCVEQLAFELDN